MDSQLVDKIVHEVKSQGVFDEFRRNSIADVDTKPAYQNLRQRVENTVKKFLSEQKWSPDINKIQLRERLRKHITDSGFLEVGVERIVDQVVNPKIFQSRIEDIAYKYLGVPKPFKPDPIPMLHHLQPFAVNGNPLKIETSQLLPTDLEQVSPDSDKATIKSDSKDECIEMDIEDKLDDDDESPPFEPLEHRTNLGGPTKKMNDGSGDVKAIDGEAEVDESERRRGTLKATTPTNVMCSKQKLEYDSETQDTSFSVKTDDQDLEKEDRRRSIEHQLKFHESQSQLSQVSSNSRLSIGTEENNDREQCRDHNSVNICEEAQMPKFNENSNDDTATLASSRTNVLHFDIKQDEIKFEGTARKSNQSLMDLAEVASASAMMEVDAGPQKHINIEDIRCPSTKDDSVSNEQLPPLLKVKIDNEKQEHHQQQQSSNSETDFVSSPKIATSNNNVQRETESEMKKKTTGGEEEEEEGDIDSRNEEDNVIGIERVASGGGAFHENGSERDEDGTKTTTASPSTSQSQSQDDGKHATRTKGERSRGHERRKEKDRRKSRDREKNRHRSRKSSTSDWSKQSSSSSRSQSIQPASSPADKMATTSNSKDSVASNATKHHSSSATGHGHSSKGRRHGHAEKKRSQQQPSSSSSSMDRRSGSSSTDRRGDMKSSSVQGDDHYAAKEKITWRKSTDSNDDDKKPEGGTTTQRRSGQHAADESTSSKQKDVTDVDNKDGGSGGGGGGGTSTSPTPPSPSTQQCRNADVSSNATKASSILTSNVVALNDLRPNSSADVVRMNMTVPPTSTISDCEMESIDNDDDDDDGVVDEVIANKAPTTTPTITENADALLFFDDNSNNMEFRQRLHVIDDAMECCRHIIHGLKADDVDDGDAGDRSQFVFIEDKQTMKNASATLMRAMTGGELEMESKRLKRVTEVPSPTASSSSSSSDASVNSKENEFTAEDIGDLSGISISLVERKGCTLHKLSQQQRYSTEELYKPRPFLGQRSRRRGLFNSIA